MTTFENYLQQFERWLILKNYALSSRKDYVASVRRFHQFCQARFTLSVDRREKIMADY